MRLATWNVNSLAIRLPHLLQWLAEVQPDVAVLQETKLVDEKFPVQALAEAGWQAVWHGQPTYNGVALLARTAILDVQRNIPSHDDPQARVIAGTVRGVRVVGVYVPNGQSITSEKYAYKLQWLQRLEAWLADELRQHPRLAVMGDWNIAPEDRDVHDPQAWAGQVLCSEPERERFRAMLGLGLVDAFRAFEQDPKASWTWWDYRQLAFQKNRGLRIDHILVSPLLASELTACRIDRAQRKRERPSDHAPVIADFRDKATSGTT